MNEKAGDPRLFYGSSRFNGKSTHQKWLCRCRDKLDLMQGATSHAGYFLLRGQEKVTKEKAARGLAAARCPALLVISGPFVQLARQKDPSLKHALSFP